MQKVVYCGLDQKKTLLIETNSAKRFFYFEKTLEVGKK